MLQHILDRIEQAEGPLLLSDLSRELNIELSALQGMIDFWVRKGRLQQDGAGTAVSAPACHCATNTCEPEEICPYVAKMPRSYSLKTR